jgi:hypothetical protein
MRVSEDLLALLLQHIVCSALAPAVVPLLYAQLHCKCPTCEPVECKARVET